MEDGRGSLNKIVVLQNDFGPAIPRRSGLPSGWGIGISQGVGGVASVLLVHAVMITPNQDRLNLSWSSLIVEQDRCSDV